MPSSVSTASDCRGIVSVDTIVNFLWVCSKLTLEASHTITWFLFLGSTTTFSRLTAAFSSGLKQLSSRKCVPIQRSALEASAFLLKTGTLFTVAHLGPSQYHQPSQKGTVVLWQLRKVEPPHGANDPLGCSSGLLRSKKPEHPLTAQEFTAKSKSTAFFPAYTLASWLRPVALLRKEELGPTARLSISRHLQKNPTFLVLNLCYSLPPLAPNSIPHQSWLVKNINLWRVSALGKRLTRIPRILG